MPITPKIICPASGEFFCPQQRPLQQLTGSTTSIHFYALLSTNSPPMKFFVLSPVALVPFHSAESFSARSRDDVLSPLSGGCEPLTAVAKDLVLRVRKRADVLESMICGRQLGGPRRGAHRFIYLPPDSRFRVHVMGTLGRSNRPTPSREADACGADVLSVARPADQCSPCS